MSGTIIASASMMSMIGNTLHNPSLLPLLEAIMRAPLLLLPVPDAMVRRSYMDLFQWLLNERNLLALGLYRNSHADPFWRRDEEMLFYTFTGPPAFDTVV